MPAAKRSTLAAARDPRIDAYIAKSAPFAQPILTFLRETIHTASPGITETIKWGMPHFVRRGIICSFAAFKEHCTFGFWNAQVLEGKVTKDAMGQFGRITDCRDLPTKRVLVSYIKAAVALDAAGVTRAPAKKAAARSVVVPPALKAALAKLPSIKARFDAMPPSHRREYCEWIAEAKRDETRERRVAKALVMLRAGSSLNAAYASKPAGSERPRKSP